MVIDLNMDVGEGLKNEAQLFPFISSCNIACGGHAGTYNSMDRVIELAKSHEVKIGAHPSFPDKANFGRKVIDISPSILKSSIRKQLKDFAKVAADNDCTINHVKAHGALYNLAAKDAATATLYAKVVKEELDVAVYAPYNSVLAQVARDYELRVILEAFADRNYNDDLSLVSRINDQALILESDQILDHVLEIICKDRVKSINHTWIPIKAETICMHSDSPNAELLIRQLSEDLKSRGIEIG